MTDRELDRKDLARRSEMSARLAVHNSRRTAEPAKDAKPDTARTPVEYLLAACERLALEHVQAGEGRNL